MPMPMSAILDLLQQRRSDLVTDQKRWDLLSDIYLGLWRKNYPEEFRQGEVAKIAPFIQRTWRLFRSLTGKVPDIRSSASTLSGPDEDRADRIEKICFNYNRVWALRRKARVLAHYFVGFGACGVGVIPSQRAQGPIMLVEDPRNCFPGPGWDSTNVSSAYSVGQHAMLDPGGSLEDMIVIKTMTGRQILRNYGKAEGVTKSIKPDDPSALREPHNIVMFYDAEDMVVGLEDGIELARAPHEAGHCPWSFPTLFAPDRPAGEGFFEQSIGMNLAFMRLLDQKLALNDAVIWPWLFTRGLVDEDSAARRLRGITADSAASMVSPPATFQIDRDLSVMREMLRLFNMETEVSQGDVSSTPVTGRGLVELQRSTVETVQSFFDDLSFYYPFVYTDALLMDRRNWPDVRKDLAGQGRGESLFGSYIPRRDIGDGFGIITVEFGPGFGGFEGHLQLLQDLGADAISVDTVMDWNPHIRSRSDEHRKIFLRKARIKLLEEGLGGKLSVPLDWMAEWITAVEKGEEPVAWLIDNAPPQSAMTPEGVPPVPPGVAAAGLEEQVVAEDSFVPPDLGSLLGIGGV